MLRFALLLLLALSLPAASPFLGRWNFNITSPTGATRASWLGITENNGALQVWYQPAGGNVYQLEDVRVEGAKLLLTLGRPGGKMPRPTLELERVGNSLKGFSRQGDSSQAIEGTPAPTLNRPLPKAWSKPESLFNGKDLSGWEPIGRPENNHWIVLDGYLVNQAKGANLKSLRKFDDFKLHFEVNYPDHANSGFYLRGRYEIQLESEPLTQNPPERRIGSIYGRIAPTRDLPRKIEVWDSFDVTLVGRTLTVVRNGVTTIDRKEIEGITGGALDANEAEPGPFYIQGDHTGGLKFRNITVALPKP
ncbi:MAG: DUF1080 domain-containing protein [Acidobacteriota bacterium]